MSAGDPWPAVAVAVYAAKWLAVSERPAMIASAVNPNGEAIMKSLQV